jgi:hypothetical protein
VTLSIVPKLCCALLLLSIAVEARAGDPVGTVLDLFATYDVVAVPEVHRTAETHEFLRALIRDPRLVERGVRNVVVEFGNAKYQSVVDRYVSGQDVPRAELRKIWRNTTQFLAWDSPLYGDFFRAVREANLQLPPSKRIRVVLGDPPIEWERVFTKSDYEKYADRDLYLAATVEREVLKKRQKALLIAGGMHLLRERERDRDVPDRKRSAGDLLQRRHAGKIFLFGHASTPVDDLRCDTPCVVVARATPLANKPFAPYAPRGVLVQKVVGGQKKWVPIPDEDWPAIGEMVDGLIHYGRHLTTVDPRRRTAFKDGAYIEELQRRARILSDVYGMDFLKQLDEALRK